MCGCWKGLFRFKPVHTLWFSEKVAVILTQHYIKGFTNRFFNIALVKKKALNILHKKRTLDRITFNAGLWTEHDNSSGFFFMLTKARKHKRIIAFRYSDWFWLTLNFGFWNLRSCVLFVLEFFKRNFCKESVWFFFQLC